MSKLTLKTEGDRHVVVTRRFAAAPEAVYRAHTEPALIQKWLLGPDGWTMPVCINEARPGGKIRYEWTNGDGAGFYVTGEYLELVPHELLRWTDTLDDVPGEMTVTVRLKKVSVGTEINIVQEGLPDAIPPDACTLGWQESLTLLAKLVEAEIPG